MWVWGGVTVSSSRNYKYSNLFLSCKLRHYETLRIETDHWNEVFSKEFSLFRRSVMCLHFQSGHLTEPLQTQCLMSALGSYRRASSRLITSMENSDLYDLEQCRFINDQIMGVNQTLSWLHHCLVCTHNENIPWCVFLQVERNLLFPYVSPRDTPFRHILLGSGSHTLEALCTHLALIQNATESVDAILLNNRIAIAAWTIQSCASAVSGNMWDTEEQLD